MGRQLTLKIDNVSSRRRVISYRISCMIILNNRGAGGTAHTEVGSGKSYRLNLEP